MNAPQTIETQIETAEQAFIAACGSGDLVRIERTAQVLEDLTRQATSNVAPALGSAALWFAQKGHPVFPCLPGRKVPMTMHGLKDASTDAEQIRAWWTRAPNANIGLPTGIAFDVIDIDGHEGQQTRAERWCYDEACRVAGSRPIPPDEWTPLCEHPGVFNKVERDYLAKVTTPRAGGMHLYVPVGYAVTPSVNRAGIYPGIDYRGEGGYVIAPPSQTTQGAYRFLGTPNI